MRARAGLAAGLSLLAAAGGAASATAPKPRPKPSAKPGAAARAADLRAGARLFAENGCASCHTLAAAGASGTAGPDLDVLGLPQAEIVRWLTAGGRSMPSFAGRLTRTQISQLALYVVTTARNRTRRPRDPRSLFAGYCGACHALAAAGTRGGPGPSLDGTGLGAAAVVSAVVGGHSPPVGVGLTADEIARIAAYVAASAAPAGR